MTASKPKIFLYALAYALRRPRELSTPLTTMPSINGMPARSNVPSLTVVALLWSRIMPFLGSHYLHHVLRGDIPFHYPP
jgi:hypothetical protein